MAKDDRKIIHGITTATPREGGKLPSMKVLVEGDEDELAASYTQAQLNAMIERGDISGKWKSTKK